MAKEKKQMQKVEMTEGKRNIIRQLLEEYDIETAKDIQDALKDLLGGTIKEMMEAEMDEHLGYEKSERSDNEDYRNGYKTKQVNSSWEYGDTGSARQAIIFSTTDVHLYRLCDEAGTKRLYMHTVRHTYATRAIGGKQPKVLQELFGHSSI